MPEGSPPPRPGQGRPPQVVAVLVTYNRRPLLLEALAAVCAQTRPPEAVIVVDNASSDGTAAAVRSAFPSIQLVELARNCGGAGGFAYGAALALRDGADFIWFMDDDTIPEPGALAALLDARERVAGPAPVLIASRVLWTDGRPHPMNTPRTKPFVSEQERQTAVAAGCQPIRSASFVSILVDAAHCRDRGLPQADYFLWNDDFEFTMRLLRGHRGVLCPASVVIHKTATFGSTDVDPGARFYYEVRNKLWTIRRGTALAPFERFLYAGASLRRWARTFAASGDRRTLRAGLAKGLADGLRTSPRPTDDVLAELGLPALTGTGSRAGN